MKVFKYIIFYFVCAFSISCFAQQVKEDNVIELLGKVQESFAKRDHFSCSLTYSMFPTYSKKKASESFNGNLIKNGNRYYTRIKQTTFLTDLNGGTSLKLNADEKIILVGDSNLNADQNIFKMLNTFSRLFEKSALEDFGSYWICTFTSSAITQIPYGKIEIYVNKKDYSINKQVFYFLSQLSYKNANGDEVMGNPRLEVVFENYKYKINSDEEQITELSHYISNTNPFTPTTRFKDFKIIQN